MGHEPENTLGSIRKALELGARCVEVDVYSVDGRLVIFHDERLERTTNGVGYLGDWTLDKKNMFAYIIRKHIFFVQSPINIAVEFFKKGWENPDGDLRFCHSKNQKPLRS